MLAAATAISGMIISALMALGPIAAPVVGAAMAAGPVATAGTAIAGMVGTGAAAGGAGAGAIGASPHAAVGVQNGITDALNQAKDAAAGSVNDLNIPGVPHISFN